MNHSVMFLNQNLKGLNRLNSNFRGFFRDPEPKSVIGASVPRTLQNRMEDTEDNSVSDCKEPHTASGASSRYGNFQLHGVEVVSTSHESAGIEPA